MTVRCFASLVALLVACGPKPTPVSTPEPRSAPALTGRVLISISDPAADEGLSWDVALSPDGRFIGENTWSDGATSFRSDCGGSLPEQEVQRWFERVRAAANLPSPPVSPGPRDFQKLEISLAFEDEDGTVLFVPQAVVDDEARTWAQGFTGECL